MSINDNPKTRQRVSCIQYLVQFQAQHLLALTDSKHNVNSITHIFTNKLGLYSMTKMADAQKIDGLFLEIYDINIASFTLQD